MQHVRQGLITVADPRSAAVHPTQLYSVAGFVFLFLVLRRAYARKHDTGDVIVLFLFLCGLIRFIVECFRGDSPRNIFGMTLSQSISLGLLFVFGTVVAIRAFARPRESASPRRRSPRPSRYR